MKIKKKIISLFVLPLFAFVVSMLLSLFHDYRLIHEDRQLLDFDSMVINLNRYVKEIKKERKLSILYSIDTEQWDGTLKRQFAQTDSFYQDFLDEVANRKKYDLSDAFYASVSKSFETTSEDFSELRLRVIDGSLGSAEIQAKYDQMVFNLLGLTSSMTKETHELGVYIAVSNYAEAVKHSNYASMLQSFVAIQIAAGELPVGPKRSKIVRMNAKYVLSALNLMRNSTGYLKEAAKGYRNGEAFLALYSASLNIENSKELNSPIEYSLEEWLALSEPAIDAAIEMEKEYAEDINLVAHQHIDQLQTSLYLSILIVVLILIATLSIGIWIIQSISKPMEETLVVTRDIAQGEGDLTMRLNSDSHDEFGEMSKWINVFIGKIQSIVGDISSKSSDIHEHSSGLSSISMNLLRESEDSATRSNSVASAAEEMSANMNSVAVTVEQASANMSTVASATDEMTATINEIAKNASSAKSITENAVEQSHQATERINELGKAAEQINIVTETISSISDQTNLLALNATIEAASAGDAGKGFAVVASEIKELARQTEKSTEDIHKKIEDIQNSTTISVTQIENISEIILDVDQMVASIATAIEEQSSTANEIACNVGQASSGIGEVAMNVTQASEVSSDISKEIVEVNASSEKVNSNSRQIEKNVDELKHLADHLKSLVSGFKI